jgi:hypothetical protein
MKACEESESTAVLIRNFGNNWWLSVHFTSRPPYCSQPHVLVKITMSYPVSATKGCFSLNGRRGFDGSIVSLRLGRRKNVNHTNDSSSFRGLIINITTGALT